MLEIDVDQPDKWRIIEPLPLGQLVLVEALVVVALDKADDRVAGVAGLENHLALLVRTASTAGNLLEHIEGTLVRTEVRKADHRVGIQHAHDAHAVEVQTFGYHLRAHQDIGLVGREVVDDAVVARLAACSVQVHARDFLTRKSRVNLVFNSLGAVAHNLDAGHLACWADVGQTQRVAAIVT